ncbi:MAG: hypothetical protein ACRELY_24520 [Polyangiaceae bacterium]
MLWGVETDTGSSLMAYTLAHGVQTLATMTKTAAQQFPLRVAISDDHIGWVMMSQDDMENIVGLQLFWSPIATQASELATTTGPMLPETAATDPTFAIGGDYATQGACDPATVSDKNPTCWLYVVKLSTQKLWAIPQRPGTFIDHVFGVNNDEIVVGERDSAFDTSTRRILRIKTSQLDALSAH